MSDFERDQQLGLPSGGCTDPALGRRLSAYCFRDLPREQRADFEAHLLECETCWREARVLIGAVENLRSQKASGGSISAEESCAIFGMSIKADWPMAGHGPYMSLCAALYALTYVFGLLAEVSYSFDRFGETAEWISPLMFIWVFATTCMALMFDRSATAKGTLKGLGVSLSVTTLAALLLFGALTFFLPSTATTRMDIPSQASQGAYFKGILYVLPVIFLYLLLPFHFVVALQRELREGRSRLTLAILADDKKAVNPPGAIKVSTKTLWILLLMTFLVSIFRTSDLLGHLAASPYLGLFTTFIYLRLLVYFGIGLVSLFWYSRALNELKRECLALELVRRKGSLDHSSNPRAR